MILHQVSDYPVHQRSVQPMVQNKQTSSAKKQIDQIVQMASPKEQETSQTDAVQPIFQPNDQIPLYKEQQTRQNSPR